jgi:hypothetical protein
MLGERARWPRRWLPETKPMQHPTQRIREAGELLDVDILTGNDLRLKALYLNRERRALADQNLGLLTELVLAAEVIGERDGDVAVAARDHATAVDATKKERIVCRGASNRKRTQGDRRAIPTVQPISRRRSSEVHGVIMFPRRYPDNSDKARHIETTQVFI